MTGIGDALTDVTLSGKTGPTEDTGNDRIGYDAADPTFSAVASTSPMDQMVIFKVVKLFLCVFYLPKPWV
jgi:hypothetical protein